MNFLNLEYLIENPWILILLALWTIPWKGVALWKASQARHKGWFIFMLVVNLLALPEIVYIFWFSEKTEQKKEGELSRL
jgi:hypothetical protein